MVNIESGPGREAQGRRPHAAVEERPSAGNGEDAAGDRVMPVVDRQLRHLIGEPVLDLTAPNLPGLRQQLARAHRDEDEDRPARDTRTWSRTIKSTGGDIGVVLTRSTRPPERLTPTVLWIHGGGYVVGEATQDQTFIERLASQTGALVAAVDYRLAPEDPYPAALDDCFEALRWLVANAGELDIDPTRIAVAGDSAGGGLAAALTLRARDAAGPALVYQALIYPMLDPDSSTTSRAGNRHVGHVSWTRPENAAAWQAYLGDVAPDRTGWAAAAHADHLGGLPPAFIAVGSLDLFLEEDITYAQRLLSAGVTVELHVHPGAVHGYAMWAHVRHGEALQRDLIEALTEAFRRPIEPPQSRRTA